MSIIPIVYFYRANKPHFLYTKETLDEFNQYIEESFKELQSIVDSDEPDVHKFIFLSKANVIHFIILIHILVREFITKRRFGYKIHQTNF